jgi:hypothetical protein
MERKLRTGISIEEIEVQGAIILNVTRHFRKDEQEEQERYKIFSEPIKNAKF